MSTAEKPIHEHKPESYSPKDKPAILSMAEEYASNKKDIILPEKHIISPKDKVAQFTGEGWPHSNTMPAVMAALGLFYGKTERYNDSGELINDEKEYDIQNALFGEAFSLFYPPVSAITDLSNCISIYGLNYYLLPESNYSPVQLTQLVQYYIAKGNAMIIRRNSAEHSLLVIGYEDHGNILLGCEFKDGDDGKNCSYDFYHPSAFSEWTKDINYMIFIDENGEKRDCKTACKNALIHGYQLMTQKLPNMNYSTLNGAGSPIYDEWIAQLERANAENSEVYYDAAPVFPHFIALYENRLHLMRFLHICADVLNDNNLSKAAALCEQLKNTVQAAATESVVSQWSELVNVPNNQKRDYLIDKLKICHELEEKIIALIQ